MARLLLILWLLAFAPAALGAESFCDCSSPTFQAVELSGHRFNKQGMDSTGVLEWSSQLFSRRAAANSAYEITCYIQTLANHSKLDVANPDWSDAGIRSGITIPAGKELCVRIDDTEGKNPDEPKVELKFGSTQKFSTATYPWTPKGGFQNLANPVVRPLGQTGPTSPPSGLPPSGVPAPHKRKELDQISEDPMRFALLRSGVSVVAELRDSATREVLSGIIVRSSLGAKGEYRYFIEKLGAGVSQVSWNFSIAEVHIAAWRKVMLATQQLEHYEGLAVNLSDGPRKLEFDLPATTGPIAIEMATLSASNADHQTMFTVVVPTVVPLNGHIRIPPYKFW